MDEVRESLKGQHEPLRSPEEKFARRVGCFPKLDIKRCESARHPAREIRTEAIPTGLRTATCSALNYLELARLGRADFLEWCASFRRFDVVLSSNRSLRSAATSTPIR